MAVRGGYRKNLLGCYGGPFEQQRLIDDHSHAESRLSDKSINSRFLPGLPMPGRLLACLLRPAYLLRLALTSSRINGVRISSIANPIFPPGTTIEFGRDMNEF